MFMVSDLQIRIFAFVIVILHSETHYLMVCNVIFRF